MRALAGVMKLVNIADLKSAAFGLAGSSPVPGTTMASSHIKPDAVFPIFSGDCVRRSVPGAVR